MWVLCFWILLSTYRIWRYTHTDQSCVLPTQKSLCVLYAIIISGMSFTVCDSFEHNTDVSKLQYFHRLVWMCTMRWLVFGWTGRRTAHGRDRETHLNVEGIYCRSFVRQNVIMSSFALIIIFSVWLTCQNKTMLKLITMFNALSQTDEVKRERA